MPMNDSKRKLVMGKAMSVDEAAGTMTVVMSTRSIDRDGDIVEPGGMELDKFNNNPVVLWAHDKRAPAIGKINQTLLSGDGEMLMGVVEFDMEDPFAKLIFNKYKNGFLRAWSVGFSADREHTEALTNDKGEITGFRFLKTELNELSAVPVPANPQALTRAIKEFDDEHMQLTFCKGILQMQDEIADNDVRAFVKSIVEKEFTKEDHNNNIAEKEPNWGSVKKTQLPLPAFVWQKPGTDPEAKSTWGYPHHWIMGGGNLNEDGVFTAGTMYLHEGGLDTAWAAAMGARSGRRADAAVVRHLQAHRNALGRPNERHLYAQMTKEGYQVFRSVDIDEDAEGEVDLFEKAANVTLAEGVFKKSIQERGRVAAIPVELLLGKEHKVEIDFEVIQERDGVIVEAKIISASVTLPMPTKADAPSPETGGGRSDELESTDDSEGTADKAGDATSSLEEIEMEMLDLAARIAEL